MLIHTTPPSYAQGWARNAGESANPNLWRGLVGAWLPSLGPTGETLRDVSGYGNHGTLTNMNPATDWVPGEKKYVLDFDGTDDHVDLGTVVIPLGTSQPFSVCSWVKLDSFAATSFPVLLQFRADAGEVVFFASDHNDYLGFAFGSDNVAWTRQRTNFPPADILGTWHHVIYTYNGNGATTASNFMVSVDIVEQTLAAAASFAGRDSGNFIASEIVASGGNHWDGQITDVLIYSRALNSNEIRQLHLDSLAPFRLRPLVVKSPTGGVVTSLVHHGGLTGAGGIVGAGGGLAG